MLLRTSPALKHLLAEPLAPMIASLAKAGSYTHLVAPHDAVGKNVFPRVAGILDVQQVSHNLLFQFGAGLPLPRLAGSTLPAFPSLTLPSLRRSLT